MRINYNIVTHYLFVPVYRCDLFLKVNSNVAFPFQYKIWRSDEAETGYDTTLYEAGDIISIINLSSTFFYSLKIKDSVGKETILSLVHPKTLAQMCGVVTPPPPPPPPPLIYRAVSIGNPPGEDTSALACAIMSGLTKYVGISFPIGAGLVLYNDQELTQRTFNNNPFGSKWMPIKDINSGNRFAVQLDNSGTVNNKTDC